MKAIIKRWNKTRANETEPPLVTQETAVERAVFPLPDRQATGWVAPLYTQSRPARLDPQVLMNNRCAAFFQDGPEVESYRLLRTKVFHRTLNGGTGPASPVLHGGDKGPNIDKMTLPESPALKAGGLHNGGTTVMVTSALPGEGKTVTAINFSFTAARGYKQTVLLVDCDLRRQSIHKMLGIPGEKGLADYIIDDCPLRDVIVWPGVEKMTLISGGKTLQGSSEVLGSPRMKDLVAEMKNRYADRYVVFDVPPVLSTADALAFAPLVDYILFVVQAGKTPLPDVKRALEVLPKEKVLGIVLNRHKTPQENYYYSYYGYYHSSEKGKAKE